MANKNLFASSRGKMLPEVNTVNAAGAGAYALEPKHALAQLVATGCLNGTFYADAASQLDTVLQLCAGLDGAFVARAAVYARGAGHMKDMPALLAALLSVKSPELLPAVFDKVIDNGRMLRNFVQVLRSGAVGRKSLGTRPKRLVQKWLERGGDARMLDASVGNDPSLADVIRMVHPRPVNPSREALYGYLIGKEVDEAKLPEIVQQFERFKRGEGEVPPVNFQLLTGVPLSRAQWVAIAKAANWQITRMNLNTFARHGVFEVEEMAELVAARLRDAELVRKARVFPYQLLMACQSADRSVPAAVKEALQDALDVALANVPAIEGEVVVLPDVSGSMQSPVTGQRGGGTSAVSCVQVAALFASAVLRQNRSARVLPFADQVRQVELNPRDSIATNAQKLARLVGGGTSCSAPLIELNRSRARAELVVFVSDNQSWMDNRVRGATETMRQWEYFKRNNPLARLVCMDLQPQVNTMAAEREDVLNIGGFSDAVFGLMARFARGEMEPGHWVKEIENVEL